MPQPSGLEPGVYVGLSMEEYHNDPAIGSSGIKALNISPEEYWFNSPLNPDREPYDSNAAKVGRAYHAMVLEPEKPFPFTIKECKSSKIEGVMGRGDYDMLLRMYKRLLEAPKHWNALHGGVSEVTIVWRDQESGLRCKIRPDCFAPEWVSDLKTCADVSNKALRYDFPKWGYHISGGMYSIGMQNLKRMITDGYQMPPEFSAEFITRFMAREKQIFCFVLQEKDGTSQRSANTTRLWNMTPYTTEIAHEKFVKGIATYHENMHIEGRWPSGYPDVEDISEDMVSASINY